MIDIVVVLKELVNLLKIKAIASQEAREKLKLSLGEVTKGITKIKKAADLLVDTDKTVQDSLTTLEVIKTAEESYLASLISIEQLLGQEIIIPPEG